MKIFFDYDIDGKQVTNDCSFWEIVPSLNPQDNKIHCLGTPLRTWISYLDNEDAIDIILEVDHPYKQRTGRLQATVEVQQEGDSDHRTYEVKFTNEEIKALIDFGMLERYEGKYVNQSC